MVRSTTHSGVFDANTHQLFTTDVFFSADMNGMIGSVATLYYGLGDAHTHYGYSSHTAQWKEFTIPENIFTCYNRGYLGLSHTRDAAAKDVYYAYNGFYDNLVRLHPIGTYQVYSAHTGDQTLLVVRDSMLYAFDPHASGTNPIVITHRNSELNLAIPELAMVHDTLRVSSSGKIQSSSHLTGVSLLIDTLLHANDADLEIFLSHDGVTDTLIYHAGGSGDNFIATQLNDEAKNPINLGSAPFTGVYRPYNPLSVFNDLDPEGDWILSVYDAATGNTGTLESWGLTLFFDISSHIDITTDQFAREFMLAQNYPNPFNPTTVINWQLAVSTPVTLTVYNMLGQRVATLVDRYQSAGSYSITFNAEGMASGIYIYQLQAGKYIESKKMILIK